MTLAEMFLSLIRGPKVYAYIRQRDTTFPNNSLEYVSETMLTVMSGCRTVCTVISPFLLLVSCS